ncbi:hypothetical protein F4553_007768 [Allocatelliglobosispora scoriae]|uniref:Protein kinase domain-containing protein n=1 Tax=Allocatelliglobosispora scoriae TaxID=643052 RepID=A0A841C1V4_9ACTN|nr:serine/threonine-protein kinase [Allocatelliglobosispora scoriae]MBB5874334.1 hypothetical protein [Allocatelliglobosispora scoriae]
MAALELINERYQLGRATLAVGGMGEIWKARDLTLRRTVIIKLIRFPNDEPDADLVHRFKREARHTARLDHPGVPAIYDVGVHKGRPYIVMQYIDGINVDDLITQGSPLPIGWVAAIGAQVSGVLIAAHHLGLIHRDLKPDNLILDREGAVKVLDFGLAAAFSGSDTSRLTLTGQVLGTACYMAPEQINSAECTPATDIYGLGCTIYDLLTGQPPFNDANSKVVLDHHLTRQPTRPNTLRGAIPVELEELVLAMLEKCPEDRPSDAVTVYNRLAPFADDLPELAGLPAPETEAVRAYTAIASRTPSGRRTPLRPVLAMPAVSRAELDKVRRHAQALIHGSEPASAARLLSVIIEPAIRAFGDIDSDVLEVRAVHAKALFGAGEYREAARQFRLLIDDMAALNGLDSEEVLDCRLHVARAHAMVGEPLRALQQLKEVLDDRLRIHGAGDPSLAELRQEIEGLKQL